LDDSDLFELLNLVESRIFFIDESFLPAEIVSDWMGDMALTKRLRKKAIETSSILRNCKNLPKESQYSEKS
jgi:hypothetical protein